MDIESTATGDMVEATSRHVRFRGHELTFSTLERVSGEQLVLFIHGLGCAKECFVRAWSEPGLSNLSLLAPDLPGHGDTPHQLDAPWSMEAYAELLHALLATFPHRHLHVVAHSMGGAVALLLFDRRELSLATFVNVEGNLLPDDSGMVSRGMAGLSEQDFVDRGFARLLAEASSSEDPSFRSWAAWAHRADSRALHQAASSLVTWSDSGHLLPKLRALSVPCCYVYGSLSVEPTVIDRLGDLPSVEIAGASHGVMEDCPEVFFPWLANWLSR